MSFEIKESVDNARELLGNMLSRLDGTNRCLLILWAMPHDKRLDEVDESIEAVEYIQCAGSSEAMTVETRRLDNAEVSQYAVGRSAAERVGQPDVAIRWDEHVVTVFQDEVFAAEEATELFAYYLVDGAVPPEFSLRRLDLSTDQPTGPK